MHNSTEEWQTVQYLKKHSKPQRYQFCSDFNDETKNAELAIIDLRSKITMKFALETSTSTDQYFKLKSIWNELIKPSGFVDDAYKIVISDKYLTTNDELNIKFIHRNTTFSKVPMVLSISFGVNGHVSNYLKVY